MKTLFTIPAKALAKIYPQMSQMFTDEEKHLCSSVTSVDEISAPEIRRKVVGPHSGPYGNIVTRRVRCADRPRLEKELALKSQRLDVLIIERLPDAAAVTETAALSDLPDGLENLTAHNVLSFKSKQEALDGWAMEELIGHYVTYRKLASIQAAAAATARPADPEEPPAAVERLLPEAAFRLYAVATRHPAKLFTQLVPSTPRPGPVCTISTGAVAASA